MELRSGRPYPPSQIFLTATEFYIMPEHDQKHKTLQKALEINLDNYKYGTLKLVQAKKSPAIFFVQGARQVRLQKPCPPMTCKSVMIFTV